MLVGYARTSTVDQQAGYDAQLRDLSAAGAEKLFGEQISSVDVPARDQLAVALDYVREGDKLLVTKLDRLARSVGHLLDVVAKLERKGVALRILAMDVDTSTPSGLVTDFHRRAPIRLPNTQVHAVFHAIIENQLAMGDEIPVARTHDRLMSEGLDRHEGIHAIGSVLAVHVAEIAGGGTGHSDPNSP